MTARGASGAVASDGRMVDLATAVLQKGGSAADACIAAWFAAAAVFPEALLAPLHLMVAGPGVGLHAYDGSVLQPGRGVPRPRGFQGDTPVPDAARVGAPGSIAAIAAAHAQDGRLSLGEIAAMASRMAQAAGASVRATLLRRVGAVGPVAVREPSLARPLLDVAGRPQGGNLTLEDLEHASACVGRPHERRGALVLRDTPVAPPFELRSLLACVCDSSAVLAVLHVALDPSPVAIEPLQLAAPRIAVPVLRGVPRVSPGTPVPVPAPVAMMLDSTLPVAAIAIDSARDFTDELADAALRESLEFDQWLRRQALALGARAALAIIRPSSPTTAPRTLQFTF